VDQAAYEAAAEMLMGDGKLTSGQTVGRYRILSMLGEGGMGKVYLAEDQLLGRKVAMKFLPPKSVADERARKRLIREARAAATLDHPNICSIYEVGSDGNQSFIVLQHVEGETLAARLKRQPLELREALAAAVQVAEALAAAHERGIIHRDIKPENIMLTARGQVKVLDFGLAKVTRDQVRLDHEGETATMLSTPGIVMGTVPYMSPEQVRGEDLDGRSDMFSFGAVLYELLTGRRLVEAKSVAEMISAILTAEPPPLVGSSAVSPRLEQLVRRCLEKDAVRRYPSLGDVVGELEGVRGEYESGRAVATGETTTVRLEAVTTGAHGRWHEPLKSKVVLVFILVALAASASISLLWFRQRTPATASSVTPTDSPAYDLYLRGKVNVGSETKENNATAIKLLEQAVAADPNLAPAWAELARAYVIRAFQFAPDAEKKKLMEDAEVAVEKALALNPNLPEGHFARGQLLWTPAKGFPHEHAIQSYLRALKLNPNLDETHHQLGMIYSHIGLLEEAQAEVEKALAINPANTLARFRLGVINLYQGRYEEALVRFKTIPTQANPALLDRTRATALFQLGRTEEASGIVEEYLRTYPSDEGGNVTSVKAMLLAKAGKAREAEETIEHAIEIGKGFGHFHHTAYNIASAYALLNKTDQALKWLQFTAEDGFPSYTLFESDANLNSLRNDRRFIDFMGKLKQQWEHYKAGVRPAS
jgi:tetratricopeptide (TPR) repeat protein/tRNA A-37 threonylcarbamoyl transferase component Bud32